MAGRAAGAGPPPRRRGPRAIDEQLDAAQDAETVNRLEAWLWLDGPGEPEGRVGGEAREPALAMNAIALAGPGEAGAGAGDLDAWSRLEEMPSRCTWAGARSTSP